MGAFWLCLGACADAELPQTVVAPAERDSGTPTRAAELPDQDAGTDAAEPEVCVIEPEYLERHKRCAVDNDCALFSYRPSCCPMRQLVGLASDAVAQAQECADTMTETCGECDPNPDRAEDGRAVNEFSITEARCVEGRCESRVAQRTCGSSHTCTADEICVSYGKVAGGIPEGASGDNSYLTFRCEPNPCRDSLKCECAQTLCDAVNDVLRKCEIKRHSDSDVVCVPYPD